MPEQLYPWLHLVGRILFSLTFVVSGMSRLVKLNDMADMAQARGVPAPKLATAVNGIVIIAGGIMVMLGWHRFIGAGLLVIFLIPTAVMMHPFWNEKDPMARMNERSHFMKDIALAGAALFIAYYSGSAWPMAVAAP